MKKYRVNTTISQKHHEILKKHTEEYSTQQKVLEHALESLENGLNQAELSPEEKLWMRMWSIIDMLTVLPRDYARIWFESADMDLVKEYIQNEKPIEFVIEWYYNKPLIECSLQELVAGIVLNIKTMSLDDATNCTDATNHYYINILHDLGINGSKTILMMNESAIKSYGAKFESHYSVRNVFFKIYKADFE